MLQGDGKQRSDTGSEESKLVGLENEKSNIKYQKLR